MKVKVVFFNYRDILMVKGVYNFYLFLFVILCFDGVGEVVLVGEGVIKVKFGDRVVSIFM